MPPKTKTKERKMKIYYNPEIEDMPFPEPASYKLLVGKPGALKDINEGEGDKLTGIEAGADITATHVAASIVDQGDLAILDQVDTAQIVNAAVQEAQLEDLAVSEGKLKDAAVALAKLADESVNADKIWKGGNVITLSAQIKDAIILNAHIGSLAAQKITSQLVDAQIANIGWAKILNVAIVDADIVNLSADKINAGILTGRVVRTASGGTRVEMKVDDNTLSVYLDGNRRVVIGAGVVSFLTTAEAGAGDIYGLGTNQLGFNVSGAGDYYMNATEFAPQAAGARGLGTTSLPFGNCFLNQTRTRLLYPASSATYDLGTTGLKWRDLFLSGDVNVGDDIMLGDDIWPANVTPASTSSIGWSENYLTQVYMGLCRWKSSQAFQKHDDIALIKKIKTKKIKIRGAYKLDKNKKKIGGKEREIEAWDEETFPKDVCPDGFFDSGAVTGFLIGTIKQIIEKVESLETKINQK